MAAPKLPVPSTMPVTVDRAWSLPAKTSCRPRSAVIAALIMFAGPPMKAPVTVMTTPFSVLLFVNAKETVRWQNDSPRRRQRKTYRWKWRAVELRPEERERRQEIESRWNPERGGEFLSIIQTTMIDLPRQLHRQYHRQYLRHRTKWKEDPLQILPSWISTSGRMEARRRRNLNTEHRQWRRTSSIRPDLQLTNFRHA